jgi:integrase
MVLSRWRAQAFGMGALRHTALSLMIASGIDDFTVMAISGHRSIRMLERYTHPTNVRKIDAIKILWLIR